MTEDHARRLRILLVDDHEVVRVGLRALLERQQDLVLVGEAGSAEEAVEMASALRPDVVVMDIRLAGRSGIDACEDITGALPETRVLMLTSYAEDDLLVQAIAAGAAGYVLKQVGSEKLIEAIRSVGRGGSPVDPSLTGHLLSRVRRSVERERREAFAGLTDQELRVLVLLTEGKSNKEIGRALALGEKTARNYVSNILSKLSLSSRAEAAAYAVRHRAGDFAQQTQN
jgi:DNA-binding NarL/FixJ family response regulator